MFSLISSNVLLLGQCCYVFFPLAPQYPSHRSFSPLALSPIHPLSSFFQYSWTLHPLNTSFDSSSPPHCHLTPKRYPCLTYVHQSPTSLFTLLPSSLTFSSLSHVSLASLYYASPYLTSLSSLIPCITIDSFPTVIPITSSSHTAWSVHHFP